MKSEQNIPDWDKDGVWGKVEDKLRKKKKRRFLYWSFIGTTSTVLLIGFLLTINNMDRTNTSLSKNPIAKSKQKTSPEEIQNNVVLDLPITLDENSKQKTQPNITEIKLSAGHEQLLSKNNIASTRSTIQAEKRSASTRKLKNKRHPSINSVRQNVSVEKKETKSVVNKKNEALTPLPILLVDLSPINFKRSDTELTNDLNFSLPQNIKKRVSTFLWLESGLSLGKKSFVNLNRGTRHRDVTEQFRFMHTNAIGIQRFLNKNWSLKVGLAYQTIYEKYEHDPAFIKEEQVFSDKAIAYELPNGLTYFEPGLTTQRTMATRSIINNNFIHRLSIPVEFAYRLKNTSWSLEPSLGFRFQYLQWFDGIITAEENHFFDLRKINETYYSNDISMGLITSLNLKYNISQKVSLGLRLNYERDDFLNLIKDDFSSRYETIGLQLGYYHSL